MKTLKKTLCLVLAVVMAVGVLVLPAYATDFDDDADITHDEAVSVLNGLGIVSGVGNGKFDPEGTFTRGDAAILLTRVLLTPAGAKDLDDTRAIFDDVPVTSNYNKYITWAVEQGHIHGVGDNKFNPTKKLTGVELAALMLEAIGEELPTDGSWKNFVAKKSKDYKLTDNISGYSAGAVITRDDAVQMMYNAMNASTSGEKMWGVYKLDDEGEITGSPVETFASIVDAAVTANYMTTKDVKYGVEAVENSDSILATKYKVGTDKDPDGFGRPQYSIVDSKGNALYSKPADAVKEYTGPVTYKQIYADLGLTKVTKAKLYIDGFARDKDNNVATTAAEHTLNTEAKDYVGVAKKGVYGVETYVYEDTAVNGVMTYKICQIIPYYATVNKVESVDADHTGVKTDTATFALVSPYFGGKNRTSEDFVDFAKDDHVILNMFAESGDEANVVGDAYELDTVTGTLSKIVTKDGVDTYTIGGNEYKACFAQGTLPTDADVGTEVTVRVDKHGNIVSTVGATEPAKTYILVLNKQAQGTTGWEGETAGSAQVYGILSDGTYGVYTVNYPGTNKNSYVASDKDVKANEIYEYVNTASGEIRLKDKKSNAAINETNAAISSGTASVGLKTADNGPAILNSQTLFIYYTKGTGNSMDAFTTRLGNNNCGTISTGAKIVVNDKKVATVVFVSGSYSASVSTNEYAYISSVVDNITTEYVNGVVQTVYHFTGYKIDGTQVDLVATEETKPTKVGLYLIGSDGSVDAKNEQKVGKINGTTSTIVSGTVTEVYGDTLKVNDTESGSAASEHYRGFTEGTYVYTGTKTSMKDNTYIGIVNAAGNFTAIWFHDAAAVE